MGLVHCCDFKPIQGPKNSAHPPGHLGSHAEACRGAWTKPHSVQQWLEPLMGFMVSMSQLEVSGVSVYPRSWKIPPLVPFGLIHVHPFSQESFGPQHIEVEAGLGEAAPKSLWNLWIRTIWVHLSPSAKSKPIDISSRQSISQVHSKFTELNSEFFFGFSWIFPRTFPQDFSQSNPSSRVFLAKSIDVKAVEAEAMATEKLDAEEPSKKSWDVSGMFLDV